MKAYVSNGKTYAYHRETGTRLKAPFGTTAFFLELAALEKPAEAPSDGFIAWGQLVHAYCSSPRYTKELAKRTKEDYRKVLDWLSFMDGTELEDWSRKTVIELRDKAYEQRNWRFANYVVAVISAVFTWAVRNELWPDEKHPVRRIDKIERPKDKPEANRPWTDEEWQVVTALAPPHLLAPIYLCGLLGWREGEVVNRPRSDYDPTKRIIRRVASKSHKLVETPVPVRVAAALGALYPHDAMTLVVNTNGTSWTENSFRAAAFKFFALLRAEGLVGEGLTVHGLRHTCATRLREGGYDLDTIKDMLGQKTDGMAEFYARRADSRRKLKAVVDGME